MNKLWKSCQKYEIYRKTGSGSYKKIKTITSGKTTSYTNKKLSANKKYTYKIRAYIKSGSKKIYGSFSAVKSAKTKCSHKYKQGICTICKAKDTTQHTHGTTESTSSMEQATSQITDPSSSSQVTSQITNPPNSSQATSSVNSNYEICPNRSNDLPHRWSDATCTAPKVCDFCEKEYSKPLGHTISKDGICKTCGQSITPLIVECNNPLTFDGVAMNYFNYNYNTENKICKGAFL